MPVAFRELAAEDPSLRIEHDAATGQVVLWTTGPAHLELCSAGSARASTSGSSRCRCGWR